MFLIYDLLYVLFLFFYLPRLLVETFLLGKYRPGLGRRLGYLPPAFLREAKGKKAIWLQAVSVGEIQSAAPLLPELRRNFPGHRLIISTVTPTGNAVARRLAAPAEPVTYFPLDFSFVINRVLDRIELAAMIIMETEIWPNLLAACRRRRIPVVFFNARISPGAFRRYRLVRPLLAPLLRSAGFFGAQSEADARRLIALGAPPEKVTVTGNVKFDLFGEEKSAGDEERRYREMLGLAGDEPVFIAGSTHAGEERSVLVVFRELKKKFPGLLLLLAPRHPERTPEVEALVAREGLDAVRFSSDERSRFKATGIVILDTVGHLSGLYAIGTVVFIGGSLVPRGGHNPIEPARFRKPVIFGPHTFNFREIVDAFLAAGAAIRVEDARRLEEETARLLAEPAARKDLGERARRLISGGRGATARNVAVLRRLLAG